MPRTEPGFRAPLPALALLLAGLLAACEPSPPTDPPPPERSWIELTVGGIPPEDRRLLVLPPSGFLIDVRFPAPDEIVPGSLTVSLRPWTTGDSTGAVPGAQDEERVLERPHASRREGATFTVPASAPLAPGSYTIWASVSRVDGARDAVSLDVAVRYPRTPPPLAGGQWIQLDFSADRDGDGLADFPADLATFGLATGRFPAVDIRVEAWVIDEIVSRTAAFYRANPSGLPRGDPLDIHFSPDPPREGEYTRICVAGRTPGEDSFIGNVLLDPGNLDRADDACDDYLPSGVFPRELTYYAEAPAYRAAFGPLLDAPAGSHPLDRVVVGPFHDPRDPLQQARREVLRNGVETFAQLVASVVAHEAGHAMGLVPPGPPGAGLFGGTEDTDFTHNLRPDGSVPEETLLMNPGPSFGFDELAGTNGAALPRLRALNFAYLQGRVLLEPSVDAIHPPPRVAAISPVSIQRDESLLTVIEIQGQAFLDPIVTLVGPTTFPVLPVGELPAAEGGAATLVGQLLTPTLIPGRYDVEIENRDGQRARLPGALEVR